MTEAELLALGDAIYNAQPSELDGGTPIHNHPRRDAILRAWAAALLATRAEMQAPGARAAPAVDRALKKNAVAASYDTDARDIARVLVRHYGDEAEAVLDRVPSHIVHVRLKTGKR